MSSLPKTSLVVPERRGYEARLEDGHHLYSMVLFIYVTLVFREARIYLFLLFYSSIPGFFLMFHGTEILSYLCQPPHWYFWSCKFAGRMGPRFG